MIAVDVSKNRQRDAFSFANINLLGRCNVHCFFCLGLDLKDRFNQFNHLRVHFSEWNNFELFLNRCQGAGIDKIYITGQNTDSLLYKHLSELVDYLHQKGFRVGLRTNGYLALKKLDIINHCELSTGYSVHTLDSDANQKILGRRDLPDWNKIIPATERPRISIVVNRYNHSEFFQLIQNLSRFKNIRYIQARRVSTDMRQDLLMPDMVVYEEICQEVKNKFPLKRRFFTDAEIYEICGMDVVFWRTIKTSVNSMNYFTDGTVSDMYFVIEGYMKYCQK